MLIFTTMINDVDDRAFMQEVYQQNERLMYAIALKYASNTQDCEDIVHDTVEKLCKNIIKIKPQLWKPLQQSWHTPKMPPPDIR